MHQRVDTAAADDSVAAVGEVASNSDAVAASPHRFRALRRLGVAVGVVAVSVGGFVGGRLSAPKSSTTAAATVPTVAATQGTDPSADSVNVAAVMKTALALQQQGDVAGATIAYQAILKAEPGEPNALYNLGVMSQQNKDYVRAIALYTGALKANPSMTDALYNRALAFRDYGDPAKAIADLQAVLQLQPSRAAALYNLGNLEIAQGDVQGGTALVEQAITIDPSLKAG